MGWWVLVPYIPCPFCEKRWSITSPRIRQMTLDFLIPAHLAAHADEGWDALDLLVNPRCSRCQRLDKAPAGTPHRACFSADCTCDCSYPKETPVAE